MIGRQVVVLGHVLRAKIFVRRRVVRFKRVDHAALHRGHDLPARQLCDRHAQLGHQISSQTHGAVFEALQIVDRIHFFLEPTKRLREHREAHVTDNVEAHDVLRQLVVKLLTTALIEPRQHGGSGAAEDGASAKERRGFVFAVPIDGHRVGRVNQTVVDGIKHLKRSNNSAGRQHVDLEASSRHLLHPCRVVPRKVLPDVGVIPRRLHLDDDRRLRQHSRCGQHAPGSRPPSKCRLRQKRTSVELFSVSHVSSSQSDRPFAYFKIRFWSGDPRSETNRMISFGKICPYGTLQVQYSCAVFGLSDGSISAQSARFTVVLGDRDDRHTSGRRDLASAICPPLNYALAEKRWMETRVAIVTQIHLGPWCEHLSAPCKVGNARTSPIRPNTNVNARR
ncbi:hypothetical protein XMM354_003275 [Aliiroseovarius sp. xm-m-354]|nr:hypothetical protein [Aliiroseovarius sp. xm-m-354]